VAAVAAPVVAVDRVAARALDKAPVKVVAKALDKALVRVVAGDKAAAAVVAAVARRPSPR
jgi:hypothetical protein